MVCLGNMCVDTLHKGDDDDDDDNNNNNNLFTCRIPTILVEAKAAHAKKSKSSLKMTNSQGRNMPEK